MCRPSILAAALVPSHPTARGWASRSRRGRRSAINARTAGADSLCEFRELQLCRSWSVDDRCSCAAMLAAQATGGGPVIVVETSKGTFAFETYPREAPKTVAHIVALVRRGFYDGQRVHRAIPGFLAQWGDPRSRDPEKEADWGRGSEASSGEPIGTAEISKKRLHAAGAVAMAHRPSGIGRQPDLRHVGAATRSGRVLLCLRTSYCRSGCAGHDGARRHDYADVREGVTGIDDWGFTRPASCG